MTWLFIAIAAPLLLVTFGVLVALACAVCVAPWSFGRKFLVLAFLAALGANTALGALILWSLTQ